MCWSNEKKESRYAIAIRTNCVKMTWWINHIGITDGHYYFEVKHV